MMLKQQCIKAGIKESEVSAADLNCKLLSERHPLAASAETDFYRTMMRAIQAAPSSRTSQRQEARWPIAR